jgi:hypothetical protein
VLITLSEVLRLAFPFIVAVIDDALLTDLVRLRGLCSIAGKLLEDDPEVSLPLFEFHDSEPLSLTVSELKLFFLNGLFSHFALTLTATDDGDADLLTKIVLELLMVPQAWALPVQPL